MKGPIAIPGIASVDTSADAETARREVERIVGELRTLAAAREEGAEPAAEALQRTLHAFKKDLR